MAASLLETFRTLSSFSPRPGSLRGAPWEVYVDWAIAQGLGPLAAYNIQYRLAGAGAPEWARDRLLSIYQGSLGDNVLKLVNFKRTLGDLQGGPMLMLGGGAFADVLYPHIAFRPLLDLELLVPAPLLAPLAAELRLHQFSPAGELPDGPGTLFSDGRTQLLVRTRLLGPRLAGEEAGLYARALPARAYGTALARPALEDALLLLVLDQARAGYEVPLISFVDLRELLLGAPALGGAHSHPLDRQAVLERAERWGLMRALYASVATAARLFEEVEEPTWIPLRASTRRLLERTVAVPVSELGATRQLKGAARLRRLLAGPGHG